MTVPMQMLNGQESIKVSDFDLAATLGSGQAFHWHRVGEEFVGLIGNAVVVVVQPEPGRLLLSVGDVDRVSRYFALDHDFAKIRRALPKGDKHLRAALSFAPGLRILRQPRWECLASFITSSLKQVAHIRQISLKLRERFGERITEAHGVELFAYPSPEALAKAGEKILRECGLGYRAKFLHQTASLIADGAFDLDAVSALDDAAACAKLCELPGVGPKIAQCTLLFAFERLGVFPIDVWIERALRELYFRDVKPEPTAKALRDFGIQHFGPYRGYAQQWLFHHVRTGGVFPRLRKGD